MSNIVHLSAFQAPETGPEVLGTAGFSDVFPSSAEDAGSTAFLLTSLRHVTKPILWVRDRMSGKEAGEMYLAQRLPSGVLHVSLNRPVDVLQAMEDGLHSGAIGAVVGEMWGEPKALSFTATKRLALRAETSGVPCCLLRHAAQPNLSAARNRWRIRSLPSARHPYDPGAPGAPRWEVELFRSRTARPGAWVAEYDSAQDHLYFAARTADGALADTGRPRRQPAPA